MAEKDKTVSVVLNQAELDAIRNGLELSRRSAERAVKGAANAALRSVYQELVAEITTLQMKLPVVIK